MSIYDFIKSKEGYREDAYWDPHGQVWTVGYGRTGKDVTKGYKTNVAQADAWMKGRIDSDREYVKSWGAKHGYNWNDNQIDALTSGVYNMGRGYLDKVTAKGTRDNATIGQKITLYNKAGGEQLPGLVTRRNEESAMFLGGGNQPVPKPEPVVDVSPRAEAPDQQHVPKPESFSDAFARARAAHGGDGGVFEWKGKKYTTDIAMNNGGEVPMNKMKQVPPMYYKPGTPFAQAFMNPHLYPEARFQGAVVGYGDPTGAPVPEMIPQNHASMPGQVFRRPWTNWGGKQEWQDQYGNFYDPKTGKLMTEEQFVQAHGYPEKENSTVTHVNPEYSAPTSEKFNPLGQGDSATPMTDAFGTGNIYTDGTYEAIQQKKKQDYQAGVQQAADDYMGFLTGRADQVQTDKSVAISTTVDRGSNMIRNGGPANVISSIIGRLRNGEITPEEANTRLDALDAQMGNQTTGFGSVDRTQPIGGPLAGNAADVGVNDNWSKEKSEEHMREKAKKEAELRKYWNTVYSDYEGELGGSEQAYFTDNKDNVDMSYYPTGEKTEVAGYSVPEMGTLGYHPVLEKYNLTKGEWANMDDNQRKALLDSLKGEIAAYDSDIKATQDASIKEQVANTQKEYEDAAGVIPGSGAGIPKPKDTGGDTGGGDSSDPADSNNKPAADNAFYTAPKAVQENTMGFLGQLLGINNQEELIGLAGQYLLARAMGMTHREAGSHIFNSVQTQRAENEGLMDVALENRSSYSDSAWAKLEEAYNAGDYDLVKQIMRDPEALSNSAKVTAQFAKLGIDLSKDTPKEYFIADKTSGQFGKRVNAYLGNDGRYYDATTGKAYDANDLQGFSEDIHSFNELRTSVESSLSRGDANEVRVKVGTDEDGKAIYANKKMNVGKLTADVGVVLDQLYGPGQGYLMMAGPEGMAFMHSIQNLAKEHYRLTGEEPKNYVALTKRALLGLNVTEGGTYLNEDGKEIPVKDAVWNDLTTEHASFAKKFEEKTGAYPDKSKLWHQLDIFFDAENIEDIIIPSNLSAGAQMEFKNAKASMAEFKKNLPATPPGWSDRTWFYYQYMKQYNNQ